MEYQGQDIYCDLILIGKLEINKIKETDNILAFYHSKPHWPIHIVVIPKKHIDSIITFEKDDESILLELLNTIKEIFSDIVKQEGPAKVIPNIGEYLDSKHLHFHIISGKEFLNA